MPPTDHDPDKCVGLVALRGELRRVETLFQQTEDWFQQRFSDLQTQVEKGTGNIVKSLDDVRRAALGEAQNVELRADKNLERGSRYFTEIFGRLRAIERQVIVMWFLVAVVGLGELSKLLVWLVPAVQHWL